MVIYNPFAGRRRDRHRACELVKILERLGYDIRRTEYWGHATQLGVQAVESGMDAIICVGGDGTLYETIAELPSSVVLAFYPTGTINLFSENLSIPRDVHRWIELLHTGCIQNIYFGRGNGRPFASVGSVGFDAQVVSQVPFGLKQRLYEKAYAVHALKEIWRYRMPKFSITLGERKIEEDFVGILVGKGPRFAGSYEILQGADPRVPSLHVALLRGNKKSYFLRYGIGIAFGTLPKMKSVAFLDVQELTVNAKPSTHVELDGNAFEMTPVTFTVDPIPRKVLAPPIVPPLPD